MADLRKAARGSGMRVKDHGVCNGNPETSVLAHIGWLDLAVPVSNRQT